MSTQYIIGKLRSGSIIELQEHSNLFDLAVVLPHGPSSLDAVVFRDASEEQLLKLAQHLIRVLSYFVEPDDLASAIRAAGSFDTLQVPVL